MGKPQAGRHTTPAAYLLDARFERLSALFIEATRTGDVKEEQGRFTKREKCQRISL